MEGKHFILYGRIRKEVISMSHYVISISREFGSGGRIIGKQLAAKLGIPCYDRTIIQKTAEKSGLSPEFIARAEDRARSRFHLSIAPVDLGGRSSSPSSVSVNQQAFFAQAKVIRELAEQGSCVIVGRCSDYVLGDNPDCLKVFVHADLPARSQRCIQEYGLSAQGLTERINQTDRGRANYYNYYTGHTWGEMRQYDLTINSSVSGIDGAVELIAQLLEQREQH